MTMSRGNDADARSGASGRAAARARERRATDGMVQLCVRITPQARTELRIKAAREERGIEEMVRHLLYPRLGLKHPPD